MTTIKGILTQLERHKNLNKEDVSKLLEYIKLLETAYTMYPEIYVNKLRDDIDKGDTKDYYLY